MKVLKFDETIDEDITLLMGNFDGLHIGHKLLIDCAKSFPHKLAIITYENLEKNNGYIKSLDERFFEFNRLGFDYCIVVDYIEASQYDGKVLLEKLTSNFNIRHIICGEDFTFGKYGQSTAYDVESFAFSKNIGSSIMPRFSIRNQRLSSNYIKSLIRQGNIAMVNRLLLEPYSIYSTVIHGNRLGKLLGYPTMNFAIDPMKVELKNAVYLCYTFVDGQKFYGLSNFGLRPTIDTNDKNYEVHLIDFCQEMYERKIEVFFLEKLRDTEKFDSLEDLRLQIAIDLENARDIIAKKYEKEGETL